MILQFDKTLLRQTFEITYTNESISNVNRISFDASLFVNDQLISDYPRLTISNWTITQSLHWRLMFMRTDSEPHKITKLQVHHLQWLLLRGQIMRGNACPVMKWQLGFYTHNLQIVGFHDLFYEDTKILITTRLFPCFINEFLYLLQRSSLCFQKSCFWSKCQEDWCVLIIIFFIIIYLRYVMFFVSIL